MRDYPINPHTTMVPVALKAHPQIAITAAINNSEADRFLMQPVIVSAQVLYLPMAYRCR